MRTSGILKRSAFVLLGLAIVAVLGLSNASRAIAAQMVDVIVRNTTANPVPVQQLGPVTVDGTVGITGTPTVGITGTPNVTVSNLPLAPGAGALLTRSVDEPARHGFQATCAASGTGLITCNLGTVPAGKTLVIDTISAAIFTEPQAALATVAVITAIGSTTTTHYLVPVTIGSSGANDFYAAHHSTRIFAQAGSSVDASALNNVLGQYSINMTISGELIDTP